HWDSRLIDTVFIYSIRKLRRYTSPARTALLQARVRPTPREARQLPSRLPRDGLPAPSLRLPEQPGGRVPGAVLPVHEPDPVRSGRQQHPERPAHRPCQVRQDGIHRDHKVERGDYLRGSFEIGANMKQRPCLGKSALVLVELLLQADEPDSR